jgi:hypothetical protein
MADVRNSDRKNDNRLLTPLLVMALIIVGGFMFYALIGQAPPTGR